MGSAKQTSVLFVALTLAGAQTAFAQGADEIVSDDSGEQDSGGVTQSSEPQRGLADRIPSVTARAFAKQGRLEVFPTVGMSLNDPFFNHVISSVGLSFHVLESLSVGVTGDFFISMKSKVPVFSAGSAAGGTQPDFNRPAYAGRLEVAWAPLYGKLSVLAETVLHLDTYVIVGGGLLAPQKGDPAVAGVVGLGQHFFLNDWFALRIEVRDQFYQMSRSKIEPDKGKSLETLLSASVGLCFYVPPTFERESL
jgi:outer membrane beta-barrel protein